MRSGYWRMVVGVWGRTLLTYPGRIVTRSRLRREMHFGNPKETVRGTLGGLLRIKNEDFWIELILRTTCKVLDEVMVIDTGSTDNTLKIIRALQEEGLPIRLIEHTKAPQDFTLVVNLALAREMRCEYFYLIDGDEIQLETSLVECKKQVAAFTPDTVWRVAVHHLFIHPQEFLRCTEFFCHAVRFQAGRAFYKKRLELSEIMVNDGIQQTNGLPFLAQEARSVFLDNVYALHCPLSQRSTIKQWQGNAEINPTYAGEYRKARYMAGETSYMRLPFFPKEILECRYSTHNYYLPQILGAEIPLV